MAGWRRDHEEGAVFGRHFTCLQGLLAEGTLILAGPTLGSVITGVTSFEAPDGPPRRRPWPPIP